jgi:protein TonB
MNTPRYLLPVSMAAALHAALLFGFPGKPKREATTVVEVPLPPSDPAPADPVVSPPEKGDPDETVRPLAGGPLPPEIDPFPVVDKINELAPPEDLRTRNPVPGIRLIPAVIGPGPEGLAGVARIPGIYAATELDHAPAARVQTPPDYPARMRQEGIGGTVLVEFEVNTAGAVVRAAVLDCSRREFAEAALRAVRQWRFEPGRRHGRVVPFRVTVPIEFGIGRN